MSEPIGEQNRKSTRETGCIGCGLCELMCPMEIEISKYFEAYAAEPANAELYYSLKAKGGSPASCINCRHCEENCSQNLPVRSLLQNVRFFFE